MPKQNSKNELEILSEINEKLDHLIAVLLIQGKEINEQIDILIKRGMTHSTISALLGIPKGTIDYKGARKKKK